MRSFDWIIYLLVFGTVVGALFLTDKKADSPPPVTEALHEEGALLPAPSAFDDQVLVQVEAPRNGLGTAFAINNNGQWLTARHVVDGCDSVGILIGPSTYVPAKRVLVDPKHDLALIVTKRSPNAVALDLETPLRIGTKGYHVGYPQGRPGEAATRLLSRSRLISRGRRSGAEPVLAWAEIGRTRGLLGSLGGISGGPVYDANGNVRGVIVAESPRRGRIYTTAPGSVQGFLAAQHLKPENGSAHPFEIENYGGEADNARRSLQVVKVACRVVSGR